MASIGGAARLRALQAEVVLVLVRLLAGVADGAAL